MTTTTNDPASTRVWMPGKAGDDVELSIGGFRELLIELPDSARIQQRTYVRNEVVYENGKPKANPDPNADSAYETTQVEFTRTVLVIQSLSGFGRASLPAAEKAAAEAEGRTVYELTPHTQVVARRRTDPHALEDGTLVAEQTIADAIAAGLFQQATPEG